MISPITFYVFPCLFSFSLFKTLFGMRKKRKEKERKRKRKESEMIYRFFFVRKIIYKLFDIRKSGKKSEKKCVFVK